MSFTLPDIDAGSWLDYQRKELERSMDEKIQGFGLEQAINEKMSGLQEALGGAQATLAPPEPAPPPPPPAPAPVVGAAPMPEPPPEVIERGMQAAPMPEPPAEIVERGRQAAPMPSFPQPRAAPAAASTSVAAPSEAPDPFAAWRQQVFASGLTAVGQAGGDVQAFAGSLGKALSSDDKQQVFAGALNAAAQSGADVQQFASGFRMPEPPAPVREPAAPQARTAAQVASSGRVNPQPSPAEVRAYITDSARARGIDPDIALRVAQSEGGFEAARRGTFKTGSSWWPFQLHYGGKGYEHLGTQAGMGNSFTAQTGFQPGDPNAWQAATDYALDRAARSGWGDWYGAKAQGITGKMGIGQGAGPRGVSLPRGEEPATIDDALSGKWKTSFDFGSTYTGNYRTGTPHRGIDIVPHKGGIGTAVEAFQPGVVTNISRDNGAGGLMVYVQDDQGLTHTYMHLAGTAPGLKVGDTVGRGQLIAQMGESGTEGSPHLHYEVRKNAASGDPLDKLIDPRPYMRGGGDTTQTAASTGFFDRITQPVTDAAATARQAAEATQQRIETGLTEMEQGRAQLGQEIESRIAQLGLGDKSITQPVSDLGTALEAPARAVQQHVVGEDPEIWRRTGNEILQSPLTPWGAGEQIWGRTGLGEALKPALLQTNEEAVARASPEQLRSAEAGARITNPNPTPDEIGTFLRGMQLGEAYAGERGDLPGGGRMPSPGEVPGAGRYESVMPEGTFGKPKPEPAPLLDRLEGFRQGVVRQLFDRDIDLNLAQEQYAKNLDRPLSEVEMVAERKRLVGDGQARVLEDEILTPAFREAGDDYDALRDLYTLRGNMQVADAVGERVMREMADAKVPTSLREAVQSAEASVRARQDILTRLETDSIPDEPRLAAARRALRSAERQVATRQAKVDAARERILLDAALQGQAKAEARKFSGGLDRAQSEGLIDQLRGQLGDERFGRVSGLADRVAEYPTRLRQRLVESGIMSEEQATEFQRLYPDWAQTRVLDWMGDDVAGGQSAGTRINFSDPQIRRYSVPGTERAREDPLASNVSYGYQVMRQARKNEAAQALVRMDEASDSKLLREVPQDYKLAPDEQAFSAFFDGEKKRYVTNNKLVGEAINSAGVMDAPEWSTKWQQVFRSLATTRNPVFLAGNTALDVPAYALRAMTWEGGSQHLPRIMGELIKSYGDTFKGITRGEYGGEGTRRFLSGGGGQAGFFSGAQRGSTREAGEVAQRVGQMRRNNVIDIRNGADLKRVIKDLVTLKPVEALGERLELAPRVAAMRLAEQRGLNLQQAVVQGRDVTIDFARGGQMTKYLNHFIPFFNVGFQGTAQIARLVQSNPGAAAWTIGSTIGMPTMVAEVWNRGWNPDGSFDEQRAKDYADVPQEDKDRGIVLMLPGEGKDEQGGRKPLYAMVDLRNFAVFSTAARDAMAKGLGSDERDWAEFAKSMGTAASPTRLLSNPVQGMSELGSIVPGLGTVGQMQMNRDLFRNTQIVSERQDERASETAKRLTPALQEVVDRVAPGNVVRPSAVDFAVRDIGAGVGASALGAGDLALAGADVLAGREPQGRRQDVPGTLPGVGGLIGRFVRSGTGQQMREASEERLTPELRRIFAEAGIPHYEPAPVDREVSMGSVKIPLLQGEQAGVQQRMNQYVEADLAEVTNHADWARTDPTLRQRVISDVIGDARRRAELEVLGTIPDAEIDRRLDEAEAKAARELERVPAGTSIIRRPGG